MSIESVLEPWIRSQQLKAAKMKDAPTFYRNQEEALDSRRSNHAMFSPNISAWKRGLGADFCSTDLLSLGSSGQNREVFLEELASNPGFSLHSGGTRVLDGNYDYIEHVEQEIAKFHGAETALIVGSGFEANIAIFTALPRPGDAIVYDELVHASTIDGMAQSMAVCKVPFRHNDSDALRNALVSIVDEQPMIRDGTRCVLIAVESVYSMDGDVCPLREMVDIAKEVCPKGNVEFIVDEAHGTGVLGPQGAGLVKALGMEKEIAVVLHTYGKALACSGAAILGGETVRGALTNFARSVLFTTAPNFPTVAGIGAGYKLLNSGATQKAQDNIQALVKHFVETVASDTTLETAAEMGIVWVPLCDDWETREFVTHIVSIRTRERYSYWLAFHLQFAGYCVFPIEYPVVPKGQSRVRLIIHGGNTKAEVDGLITALSEWAQEMIDIESSGGNGPKVPKAAQKVHYHKIRVASPDAPTYPFSRHCWNELVFELQVQKSKTIDRRDKVQTVRHIAPEMLEHPIVNRDGSSGNSLAPAPLDLDASTTQTTTRVGTVTTVDRRDREDNATKNKPVAFYLAFCALLLNLFLYALDATTLGVAIPSIVAELGGSTLESFWASNAYILAVLVTQPLYATLSDMLGRKKPLYSALILFFVGSLVFALARNMTAIIAGRVMQGLGGGGLDVLSEIILTDMTTLKERPLYLGLMAIPTAIGTVLGPSIGGLFSAFVTWRWIGWLNLPIIGVSCLLTSFFLRLRPLNRPASPRLKRLDWVGIALFASGSTLFALPVSWAGTLYSWNAWPTILMLIIGLSLLTLFAWYERRPENPVMPHRLFHSRTTVMTLIGTFFHGMSLYSMLQWLPLLYQAVFFKTALQSAVMLLPTSFTTVVCAIAGVTAVGIVGKGYRWGMLLSWTLVVGGTGILLVLDVSSSDALCIGVPLLWGAGIGSLLRLLYLPSQASVLHVDDMGSAVSALMTARLLGGLLGIAICSTVFNSLFDPTVSWNNQDPESLMLPKNTDEAIRLIPKLRTLELPDDVSIAIRRAYLSPIRAIFYVLTAAAACGLLSSFFIKELNIKKTEVGQQRFEG